MERFTLRPVPPSHCRYLQCNAVLAAPTGTGSAAVGDMAAELLSCGQAYYDATKIATFLKMTLAAMGDSVYPPTKGSAPGKDPGSGGGDGDAFTKPPTTQQLSDSPYESSLYSDCHSATQVVVTSPLATSNLTIIGPRLLVAWPAGNSGAAAFFRPSEGGVNGSLSIGLSGTESATGFEYLLPRSL
ncbi:hypothetical protein CERZMDRAFT_86744 [Cercospora zeae-maydis SCOH1-5]|uniref:Uncharacterized protein n=1 Tax=Cercospora zeae-maydis SCOH1-5 TaxID=717836 RepID=A0A6A6F7B5_9PEZI|nr:hypothetical protein CERZMDRAFT_86744 [Cercospora zeae-maydis SCOH1-5]